MLKHLLLLLLLLMLLLLLLLELELMQCWPTGAAVASAVND